MSQLQSGGSIFNEAFTEGLSFPNEEGEQIDILKATPAQIKAVMINSYEPNKIRQQTSFNAVVCAVLRSRKVGNVTLLRVKARIPEIHTMIPLPGDMEERTINVKKPSFANLQGGATDFSNIALHPTFVGQLDQLSKGGAGNITVGQQIEVSFDNMSNYASGKIIRILGVGTPTTLPALKTGKKFADALTKATPTPDTPIKGKHFGPNVIVPCFQGNCQAYRRKVLHDPQITAKLPNGQRDKSKKRGTNVVPSGPAVKGAQRGMTNGRGVANNPILGGFQRRSTKIVPGTSGPPGCLSCADNIRPRIIVLHQGSYTLNHTLHTLRGNGFGTHYEIFHDGTIYEYFPPGKAGAIANYKAFGAELPPKNARNGYRTAHAGGVNDQSIGIDLTMIGTLNKKTLILRGPRQKFGFDNDGLHRYTQDQRTSLKGLITKLCKAFDIPNVGLQSRKSKRTCWKTGKSAAIIPLCVKNGIGIVQHLNVANNRGDVNKNMKLSSVCNKVYTGPFPIS